MEQVRFNQHISPQIWGRLLAAKGKIIIEPTGSQEKFELARKEYSDKIKQDGEPFLYRYHSLSRPNTGLYTHVSFQRNKVIVFYLLCFEVKCQKEFLSMTKTPVV
jgi:hypothetical protein